MAVIKQNFGEGGSSLTPAGQGQPSLAEVLRDIADDLAAINAALAQLIADYNDLIRLK